MAIRNCKHTSIEKVFVLRSYYSVCRYCIILTSREDKVEDLVDVSVSVMAMVAEAEMDVVVDETH